MLITELRALISEYAKRKWSFLNQRINWLNEYLAEKVREGATEATYDGFISWVKARKLNPALGITFDVQIDSLFGARYVNHSSNGVFDAFKIDDLRRQLVEAAATAEARASAAMAPTLASARAAAAAEDRASAEEAKVAEMTATLAVQASELTFAREGLASETVRAAAAEAYASAMAPTLESARAAAAAAESRASAEEAKVAEMTATLAVRASELALAREGLAAETVRVAEAEAHASAMAPTLASARAAAAAAEDRASVAEGDMLRTTAALIPQVLKLTIGLAAAEEALVIATAKASEAEDLLGRLREAYRSLDTRGIGDEVEAKAAIVALSQQFTAYRNGANAHIKALQAQLAAIDSSDTSGLGASGIPNATDLRRLIDLGVNKVALTRLQSLDNKYSPLIDYGHLADNIGKLHLDSSDIGKFDYLYLAILNANDLLIDLVFVKMRGLTDEGSSDEYDSDEDDDRSEAMNLFALIASTENVKLFERLMRQTSAYAYRTGDYSEPGSVEVGQLYLLTKVVERAPLGALKALKGIILPEGLPSKKLVAHNKYVTRGFAQSGAECIAAFCKAVAETRNPEVVTYIREQFPILAEDLAAALAAVASADASVAPPAGGAGAAAAAAADSRSNRSLRLSGESALFRSPATVVAPAGAAAPAPAPAP